MLADGERRRLDGSMSLTDFLAENGVSDSTIVILQADAQCRDEMAERMLNEEKAKESPNTEKLLRLFLHLNSSRRQNIKDCSIVNASALTQAHPLLGEIRFIREEFKAMLNRSYDEMVDEYHIMLRRLDAVFGTGIDDELKGNSDEELELLLKLQSSLREKRTKTTMKLDAITVVEAHAVKLESNANDPPSLLIARHQGGLHQAWLRGDGIVLSCGAAGGAIVSYILDLMAAYCAWDLQYPKVFPILKFIQINILGETAAGPNTVKFSTFLKRYSEVDKNN